MNTTPALMISSIAEVKAQMLSSLCGNDFDEAHDFDGLFSQALLSQIPDMKNVTVGVLSSLIKPVATQTSLHTGRNIALADPESAYRMMTLINNKDVLYKAQFFELSRMGDEVARMQQAGQHLGDVKMDADDIKAGLQDFTSQYNNWVSSFEPDMQGNGLLAGTQAAQLSRYELEQSVRYRFNGVSEGLHGLADLGITVLPGGKLALDDAKLDGMLSSNPKGAVATVHEFGTNFAKAAELLNADNNFIPNQLDNLDRAIHYIDQNHAAWQVEFGTGAVAKPAGQVAQALAAYNRTTRI